MTHPSFEYVLVGSSGAIVTFVLTPVARRIAIRVGAVAKPRDRDVHAVATPRLGGIALFAGITLAILVGLHLPTLKSTFNSAGPNLSVLILSGAIICLLGVLDDRFELDSLTKLAGQVVATGVMVTQGGVQLEQIYVPGEGTVSFGQNLGIPLTILLTLVTINAVNFIDGLDGLAAGVTAISALAFFIFAYHLAQDGYVGAASPPTLIAAALVGACIGFLPHNFSPARIFMGDSGSMLVGLMLSAAYVTATEGTDPSAFGTALGSLPILLPLIIPLTVLALPFIDLLLAVTRRVRKGRSPFSPDKQHLHHRFLEIGHSHRRAVLLLYFWSALIAFGGVGLSYEGSQRLVIWVLSVLAVVGLLLSLLPSLRDRVTGPFRGGGARAMARHGRH